MAASVEVRRSTRRRRTVSAHHEGETVVVCEVKARTTRTFGDPVEAISRAKLLRLRRLAARWVCEHPGHGSALRLDVVGLLAHPDGTWAITHLEGVG